MRGACAIKDQPPCGVRCCGYQSKMKGAIEFFKDFDAGRLEVFSRGDQLVRVAEIEVGGFEEVGRDDAGISDFARAGDGVEGG